MKIARLGMIALAVLSPVAALATTACDGSQTAGQQFTVAKGTFVLQGFTATCSPTVSLYYTDGTSYFGVAGASLKGANYYQGSSGGGSITGKACAATPCTATDASGNIPTS